MNKTISKKKAVAKSNRKPGVKKVLAKQPPLPLIGGSMHAAPKKKSGRGGKRNGSGRKKTDFAMKALWLSNSTLAMLEGTMTRESATADGAIYAGMLALIEVQAFKDLVKAGQLVLPVPYPTMGNVIGGTRLPKGL